MIVECDQCRAKYHYDEARFAGKPSKKLRCSKCRAIFEIFNTHAYEAQPPLRSPIAAGETRTRRSADMFPEAAVRPEPARERRRSAGPLKLPLEEKLSLAVIAGPDAGRMFAIETPRVVIGREEVDSPSTTPRSPATMPRSRSGETTSCCSTWARPTGPSSGTRPSARRRSRTRASSRSAARR